MFIREKIPSGDFDRTYRFAMLDVLDEYSNRFNANSEDYRLLLMGA
jgi:hypothetical protein